MAIEGSECKLHSEETREEQEEIKSLAVLTDNPFELYEQKEFYAMLIPEFHARIVSSHRPGLSHIVGEEPWSVDKNAFTLQFPNAVRNVPVRYGTRVYAKEIWDVVMAYTVTENIQAIMAFGSVLDKCGLTERQVPARFLWWEYMKTETVRSVPPPNDLDLLIVTEEPVLSVPVALPLSVQWLWHGYDRSWWIHSTQRDFLHVFFKSAKQFDRDFDNGVTEAVSIAGRSAVLCGDPPSSCQHFLSSHWEGSNRLVFDPLEEELGTSPRPWGESCL